MKRRIIITEDDLTSNVELLSSYDVAYVPGFRAAENLEENSKYYRQPTLFTDQYKFKTAMGDAPAEFTADYYYYGNFKETAYKNVDDIAFAEGDADSGYRIAHYLLSLGIPVYYEVMNAGPTIDVADMYAGLSARFVGQSSNDSEEESYGAQMFESPGDYSIKFITTGGYPVFEHGTASLDEQTTEAGTGVTVTSDNEDSEDVTTTKISITLPNTPVTNPAPIIKIDGVQLAAPGTLTVDGNEVIFIYEEAPDETPEASTITVTYTTVTGEVVANSIVEGMLQVAAIRGDAIALIDHTNYPDRPLTGEGSVLEELRNNGTNINNLHYGAMFTPWYESMNGKIAVGNGENRAMVPASVAYLSALAVQLRDYNPWLAVSGTTRGKVPSLSKLHTGKHILSNNIADLYQALPGETIGEVQISINPITYIRNVGYCIWGNRTLRNNSGGTRASSFLNIRSATADVKKAIYEASQSMLFEQNTEITWLNFKAKIEPLLDRMVSNYILEDFSIVRYVIDPETGDEVPAYKVLGVIKIRPYNSIEVFELSVQLENTSAIIAEM